MVEFIIKPHSLPPSYFSAIFKFLWLAACMNALYDMCDSTTSIAFNCDRASVMEDQNMTSLYHNNYAYSFGLHSHVAVHSMIIHELRIHDVAFVVFI